MVCLPGGKGAGDSISGKTFLRSLLLFRIREIRILNGEFGTGQFLQKAVRIASLLNRNADPFGKPEEKQIIDGIDRRGNRH